MQEKSTTGEVIIVFTEHPVLGSLLIPYIAEKDEDGTLCLVEQAFHASEEAMVQMSQPERDAIQIASRYTEKYLMGAYSREKTISRFLRKLSDDPEKVKSNIRPFIEKKLLEMLTLIRNTQLPLYQKQSGSKVLYAHHAYQIQRKDVEIRCLFHVESKTFTYQLQCFYEEQPLSLIDKKPVVTLTSSPATLLLGMEIYFFPHIESMRLLPFTKKRSITADIAQVDKYIDNIVVPIARYHDIATHGLEIAEEERNCESLLTLEGINSEEQSLALHFRYGNELFAPDSKMNMKRIVYRKESGKVCSFVRNTICEKKALKALIHAKLQQVDDIHFKLSPLAPESSITEWITHHREMVKHSFVLTESTQNTPFCLDEIHVQQSYEDGPDWFELHITVVIGHLRIPFSRFRKHILEEKREYLLPDGRLILLPDEWFSKYANLLELGTSTEEGIQLKHTYIGAAQAILKETDIKHTTTNQVEELPAPEGLNAQLRPYQQKGFSWMMHLHKQDFCGCLADDMGLGKTLQTLALLQHIYNENSKTKRSSASKKPSTLIVVPTSLLHNWRRETKRFTTLKMFEYHSHVVVPKSKPERFFGRFQLILTSYGTMRNNIDTLKQYCFEYVILDESQNIKNSDSITFRSAIQLQSNHRLALTGTPIENSLKDLWAQFRFLQPELLGAEADFQKTFALPIRQGNTRMEARLQQLITPFILRRSKSEVAPELPALTEETIYCDMTEEQHHLYEQEKNSLRNILLQQSRISERHYTFSILNGILRLRQLACHPQLVIPEYKDESGKMSQIIDTFDTLRSEGHKVLIFSSFVKHLELLADAFRQREWKYALLTGSTNDRPAEIAHFTEQKDVQAFLISLKAGGVGLNLTQADYVFVIDPWWNPAAEAQAIARAHRIGQEKQVIAYRFITQNSIEEKIRLLQDEKRKLAELLITDSDALPHLSEQEWADLLQ